MAQEDNQKCSSSKKPKQKKIPQRGLGVAQLEKIRVEEEKKNEAAVALAAGAAASASGVRSPPLVFPNQNQSVRPSTDLPSFRPRFDTIGHLPTPPQPVVYPRNNYNGMGYQSPAITPLPSQPVIYGHNDFSSHRSMVLGRQSNDQEGPRLNPRFMFQSRLHNEMNSNGSSSSAVMQNQHYHQQQQNQFPKMNASNSMSSGVNLQIELPSNQSYHSNYSNYRLPPWPEDDKMAGMKRSWPFSVENPQSPSVDCNHRPFMPRNFGTDEKSSYENGGTMYWDPRNSFLREGPSDFAAHQFDSRVGLPEWNIKNGIKENGASSIDTSLTLALPTAPTSPVRIKAKQPMEFPSSSRDFSEFNVPPHQEYMGGPHFRQSEPAQQQQQQVYSFFPPPQNGKITDSSSDQRSEIREKVDLNLKL